MISTADGLPWQTASAVPSFLSPAEQQKLAGMRFPRRRDEWLLGRWTARRLLLACAPGCAGLEADQITIENEPGGAPRVLLPGGALLSGCLSISHRAGAAFCAYAPTLPVGADLEWIEPRSLAFINDYLTPAEAARALALLEPQRAHWANLAWSAKEAALKALRTGLTVDSRAVEVLRDYPPAEPGWGRLEMRSGLPGLAGLQGFWQQQGGYLLTLAAICPEPTILQIRSAPG